MYVCKAEKALTVEQAKLLKLLGHKMAKFHLKVLVQRTKKGKITRTEFGDQHLVNHKEWIMGLKN